MTTPPCARDLAIPVTPVSPNTTCAAVFDRLLSEPEVKTIPVVQDGVTVGLVGRKNFLLTYVRMYGAELYGKRPVSLLMEQDILTVDGGVSCEAISAPGRDASGSARVRPFVVTERGVYAGVGDTTRLMMVMADLAIGRAAALQEETRKAEAANASKTQFLASMSHELRTPLNAIIGFTDLMRLKTLGEVQPPRYAEYVEDIHASGLHLLSMINELLDMAKIESGHVELQETVFCPTDVGVDVLRMLRQAVVDAKLLLRVDVADDLPPIHADRQQVHRILVNLLSNSIKYTPAGGVVTLSARICEPDGSGSAGGMLLTVTDTGIGIPADMLETVLEPFEQVENSLTRTRAGTGLGLALTKAMVEAHGGRLWLESILGRGTKAHALLPACRIVRAARPRSAAVQRGASPV